VSEGRARRGGGKRVDHLSFEVENPWGQTKAGKTSLVTISGTLLRSEYSFRGAVGRKSHSDGGKKGSSGTRRGAAIATIEKRKAQKELDNMRSRKRGLGEAINTIPAGMRGGI